MGPPDDGERGREAGTRDLVADGGGGLGPFAARWELRAARLRELDAALGAEPDRLDLLVERAELVDELNQRDEALSAYAAVLQRDPSHYRAMMRFGALLAAAGNGAAARTVFTEAATRHPAIAAPHVCLGSLLVDAGEHGAALAAYERAAQLHPEDREAQRGIAVILERDGRLGEAAARWRSAFPGGSIESSGYRGNGVPRRVLCLTSALGGNVPLQHVLDERVIQTFTVIAESAQQPVALPPHDVVFNAIGDADRCGRALDFAERIVEAAATPVLNPPPRVRCTTRAAVAQRLAPLPGVVTPAVEEIPRAALRGPRGAERLEPLGRPVLLRSPGFHTGEHFVRLDDPSELPGALDALPGETLLAIGYVDTRGADGAYRKYRVMTIGGRLYPLHLAVGANWKVHYFSAETSEHAAYRAEEAAFLADMEGALGAPAATALHRIALELALDYGGIDFALDDRGRVVVFEANATMVLLPPPAGERWDYRRPPIDRAIHAARALLLGRPDDDCG